MGIVFLSESSKISAMNGSEQAVQARADIISAIARKGFRSSGRGVVTLTLAPNSDSYGYLPINGNEGSEAPFEGLLRMAADYDPETTAVVAVLKVQGGQEEVVESMLMTLAPDSDRDPLADGLQVSPDMSLEASLFVGEDHSLMSRNIARLQKIATEGWLARGLGVVVVYRGELPAGHWLIGHAEEPLPPEEETRCFYVPLGQLQEGPIAGPDRLESYDARTSAVIMFLRADGESMTYEIGVR
jgi:hypothetical protein